MDERLLARIDGFDRVDLDGLNRRAALLDRDESKYVITTDRLGQALDAVQDDFDVLEIEGRSLFTYDTVYYDTRDRECYRQHAQGRRLRSKVRSRRYVDSDLCYFEVKLKGRRGRTIKHRMPYGLTDHGTVTAEAAAFFGRAVETTYGTRVPIVIEPALAMRYRRLTLVGKRAPERVTIDLELGFRTPTGDPVDAPSTTVIVEVKSPDGQGLADGALRRLGTRPESCSKYCIGLNLVGADVAHNAFNHTLRAHFDWNGPHTVLTDDQQRLIDRITEQLCRRFSPGLAPAAIAAAVREQTLRYRDSSVRTYLEILITKSVVEELLATTLADADHGGIRRG